MNANANAFIKNLELIREMCEHTICSRCPFFNICDDVFIEPPCDWELEKN